jgi:rod shape-determining protein MreC
VRRAGAGASINWVAVGVTLALFGAGATFLVTNGHEANSGAAGDDAATAGLRATSGPFAAVGAFFTRAGDSWNAAEQVKALREENKELKLWRDQALMLADRMEKYETLLNIPAEPFAPDMPGRVSARLVLDSGGPFKRTLVANAGTVSGVKKDYIVINENGLVGRVVGVGERSSRVLLLDDFNSRVPVMGQQSRVRALLAGDSSDAPTLDMGVVQVSPPRLDFQVPENALREGERIVTSGDGGVFPRGVLVGFAVRAAEGKWRVRLSAASKPIDFVVMLPFAAPQASQIEVRPDQEGAPLPPAAIMAALPEAPVQKPAPRPPPPPQAPPPKQRPRPVLGPDEDEAAPPTPDSAATIAPVAPTPAAPPQ